MKGFMQITLEYNNSVNKGLQSVLYAPTVVFLYDHKGPVRYILNDDENSRNDI